MEENAGKENLQTKRQHWLQGKSSFGSELASDTTVKGGTQCCFLKAISGVPVMAQGLRNPTRNHEVAGTIPGLAQWVKDPALQ